MRYIDTPFGIPIKVVDPTLDIREKILIETKAAAENNRENIINPWAGKMDATFRFDQYVNVLEDECPFVKDYVYGLVNEFLDELDLQHPYSFVRMDESWINYSKPGYYQEFHMHPESDISGILYVTAPENSGDLMFNSPAGAYNYHKLTHRSNRMHASVTYRPYEGRAILFPSYMEHMVGLNKSNDERISIAFNVKLID